jgi:undecaprenyl diphosphate synthase
MHVAIIMDGNGRRAMLRGLPRIVGAVEGAKALHATVEAAARAEVETLTLYAICTANWARPPEEVDAVLRLLSNYLHTHMHHCVEQRIRVSVIGRCERLNADLLRTIEQSEQLSAAGARMHLRIVIDYSAHDSIVQAVWSAPRGARLTPDDFHRRLCEIDNTALPAGAVDLLIRTKGGKCLSDFMLWEVAYAQLYCADCLWPDFNENQLQRALGDYAGRRRPLQGNVRQ